ncbi:MAG: motility protein A [Planctomycetota bacterium]
MDIATFLGLIIGLSMFVVAIVSGGNATSFLHWPSLLIMLGGTISAVLIHFPARQIRNSLSIVGNCFFRKLQEPSELIDEFRQYAQTARRSGLRSLDTLADEATDPFMKLGFELVASDCEPGELSAAFDREKKQLEQRHTAGRRLFEVLGAAAPAWGMVGTLIGLIQMLGNLQDPKQIGSGLALALLTTLYGALFSNLICMPLAGKLEARHAEEESLRDAMAEGFHVLLEEHSPAAMESRLRAWVPPAERREVVVDKAKAS